MRPPKPPLVEKIVSGGQTGVDRAALDAAMELGIPHGGWCPRGRLAEDGPIPPQYELIETISKQYHVRTLQNVLDSDATLVIFRGELSGGTDLTRRYAVEHHKPSLLVDLEQPFSAEVIRDWLVEERVRVLNVAGPRESSVPGIAAETKALLHAIFP